ncbi:MAG: peptide-methionine (S)-S-oxide reductase MsrA [Verrucomicrobiaceae bacterium]|jgi:peptide-methionine (S)-S-oxide reductase|nr:peptide-methionine (S)-S-oxide reductase MsrA [Verrucomicrobiaceae bacterium]
MKTFAKLLTAAIFAAMSLPTTAADAPASKTDKAYIGGGCFWCVEAQYLMLKGVKKVVSGYSGGKTENPTYEDICTGKTGHAEVIEIEFDPAVTSFKEIIELFWEAHDPTSVTKEDTVTSYGKFIPKGTPYQGNDYGTQYRSIILYTSEEQKKIAEESKVAAKGKFKDPIATEIVPLVKFYKAEDYHQNFGALNPDQGYVRGVVKPKAEKFKHTLEDKGKLKDEKK